MLNLDAQRPRTDPRTFPGFSQKILPGSAAHLFYRSACRVGRLGQRKFLQ